MTPLYPRPATITPRHKETWCALHQARYLAEFLEPQSTPKVRAIKDAYDMGDLELMAVAMWDAGRLAGPDVVASPEWREMAQRWQSRVERRIFGKALDVFKERKEAPEAA